MTLSENQAFMEMNARVEDWTVERLKLIMELSELWNSTPKEVLQRLNIKARKSVYA